MFRLSEKKQAAFLSAVLKPETGLWETQETLRSSLRDET